MWVFTQDGYFSAVKNGYCMNDEVMVRSREKDDLVRLSEVTKFKGTILYNPDDDYPFRVIMKKSVFAAYLAWKVQTIEYEQFRQFIRDVDGEDKRAIAYSSVWAALKNA